MVCVCFYIAGTPGESTDSGSGEAEDQTCYPCFKRHSAYPLHHSHCLCMSIVLLI